MEHNRAVSADRTVFEASPAPVTGPFVVNLCASLAPIELKSTSLPGLERYRLYQVRRVEEDRPRYRLRLGFFADEAATEIVLNAVRDLYPAAFVVAAGSDDLKHAPGFDLASMGPRLPVRTVAETTGTYRSPQAPPAPRREPPVTRPAQPATVAPKAAPAGVPVQAATQSRTPATVLATQRPRTEEPTAPSLELAAEPPSPSPGTTQPAAASTPFRVKAQDPAALSRAPTTLQLQPEAQKGSAKPAHRAQPVQAATGAVLIDSTQTLRLLTESELSDPEAPQFYAVLLAESDQPINLDTMPKLDIFAAFRLYSIAHTQNGRIVHSMRLGFFKESVSAEAVAGYLKTFFSTPGVMRVSAAEHTRFANPPLPPVLSESAGKSGNVVRLHENRAVPRKPATAPVLREGISQTGERPGLDPRTAAKAMGTATREPAAPVPATQKPPAQAARKPAPAPGKRVSTRPRSLNEQLLEEARQVVLSESGIRRVEQKGSLLSRLVGKLTR